MKFYSCSIHTDVNTFPFRYTIPYFFYAYSSVHSYSFISQSHHCECVMFSSFVDEPITNKAILHHLFTHSFSHSPVTHPSFIPSFSHHSFPHSLISYSFIIDPTSPHLFSHSLITHSHIPSSVHPSPVCVWCPPPVRGVPPRPPRTPRTHRTRSGGGDEREVKE